MIFCTAPGPAPPRAFQVFGDRCSGTNYVSALLAANFPDLDPCVLRSDGDLALEWRFGWKHGFPTMPVLPDWVLFVVVFRHPETWARSLHRTPWHAARHLRDLPFDRFLRSEWQGVADNSGFGVARRSSDWGAELNLDRHPVTGSRFADIAEMRRIKLEAHLSFERRGGVTLGVTYETVSNAPEDFIADVAQRFGLTPARPFQSVTRYKGRTAAFAPAPFAPLCPDDQAYLWSRLEQATETRLGYTPLPSIDETGCIGRRPE